MLVDLALDENTRRVSVLGIKKRELNCIILKIKGTILACTSTAHAAQVLAIAKCYRVLG